MDNNSDSYFYCQLRYFYIFTGIVNPDITIIPIFVNTCLYKEHFLLCFCDISYPCYLGHSLVVSKRNYLATDFRYELALIDF